MIGLKWPKCIIKILKAAQTIPYSKQPLCKSYTPVKTAIENVFYTSKLPIK